MLIKKLSAFGTAIMVTLTSFLPLGVFAETKDISISPNIYVFSGDSAYEIDSSEPVGEENSVNTFGALTLSGDVTNQSGEDSIPHFLAEDNTQFSLTYNYEGFKPADNDYGWFVAKDSHTKVNGYELGSEIGMGLVLLQTSYDGVLWVNTAVKTDVEGDVTFDENNGINEMQLFDGCYYRIIAAFRTERAVDRNFDIKNAFSDINSSIDAITLKNESREYAEVYTFYAGYPKADEEQSNKKTFKYTTMDYNTTTPKNDYVGSEAIDKNNMHYGWSLGEFCLSGYTDTGNADNIYLKTVGDKIKLSFKLKQNINKLNGRTDLVIAEDANGCDGDFQTLPHNMGRGELLVKHTNAEGESNIIQRTNFLEACASPGIDTTVDLLEEGDYEVHLDYAIKNSVPQIVENISGITGGLIGTTSYYRTSFSFKIRNGNCMVYIFDSENGNELNNGDVTSNGFRIDTAKSDYPKLTVEKKILNNTGDQLIEDTRFNKAVTDGASFTDEGIYTITAHNRYDSSIKPCEKTIYIGTNEILTKYTKQLNSENPCSFEEIAASGTQEQMRASLEDESQEGSGSKAKPFVIGGGTAAVGTALIILIKKKI